MKMTMKKEKSELQIKPHLVIQEGMVEMKDVVTRINGHPTRKEKEVDHDHLTGIKIRKIRENEGLEVEVLKEEIIMIVVVVVQWIIETCIQIINSREEEEDIMMIEDLLLLQGEEDIIMTWVKGIIDHHRV
jgi:hypothetical protein